MSKKVIYCCNCQKDMECDLISGKQAYPHRDDIYGNFWQCVNCKNFVGCHKTGKGKRNLGVIPTPKMKIARSHIHKILDPLWQTGRIKRSELYRQISEHIGFEYHTAELRTIEDHRKVWVFVKKLESTLTGHVFDVIDNVEKHIGFKCHVVGWDFRCVFILQAVENDFLILKTPKTGKIYKTKNKITHLKD